MAESRLPWTDEETAIAVAFAMWGYGYEAISQILNNRQASLRGLRQQEIQVLPLGNSFHIRTAGAVEQRLLRLRNDYPDLRPPNGAWNREAVARYLSQLAADHQLIRTLLHLTDDEARWIVQVLFLTIIYLKNVTNHTDRLRTSTLISDVTSNGKSAEVIRSLCVDRLNYLSHTYVL